MARFFSWQQPRISFTKPHLSMSTKWCASGLQCQYQYTMTVRTSGEKYKHGVGTNTSETISSTDLQNIQGFKNWQRHTLSRNISEFNAERRSDRESVASVHVDCVNADNSALLQLSMVWSSMVLRPPQALHSHQLATKSASESCWHLVAAQRFQSSLVHCCHQ